MQPATSQTICCYYVWGHSFYNCAYTISCTHFKHRSARKTCPKLAILQRVYPILRHIPFIDISFEPPVNPLRILARFINFIPYSLKCIKPFGVILECVDCIQSVHASVILAYNLATTTECIEKYHQQTCVYQYQCNSVKSHVKMPYMKIEDSSLNHS